MTQKISTEPEGKQYHISSPPPDQEPRFPHTGIISLLVIISLLLLLFAGLALRNLPRVLRSPATAGVAPSSQPASAGDQNDSGLLQTPGKTVAGPLQVPAGYDIIYEQQDGVYVVPATGGTPQKIATPGYIYSRSTPPVLTPSGQLLYSGNGLWVTGIFNGAPRQIAMLPAGQVITSLALSRDGTAVAWSTEPANGSGMITLYAGPLSASKPVYEHAASDCPCFRVFAFMNGAGHHGDTTLLLTDDRGDHDAVYYGLWLFNLAAPTAGPRELMGDASPRSPLALSPANNLLLSNDEGVVPAPSDGSAPEGIAGLSYANSLSMTTLSSEQLLRETDEQVILPEQRALSDIADYHWVTTPLFSPDGQTLAYVEFSSDDQAPFSRHSALYTVQVSGSGQHLRVGQRQLLATTGARFIELGAWLNEQIVTFYADGSLYALDVNSGAVASITHPGTYSQIVAVAPQSAIQ